MTNAQLIQRALDLLPLVTDADVIALSRCNSMTSGGIAQARKDLEAGLRDALVGKKNPTADFFFRRAKKWLKFPDL
jgi:hypothetical protein